ncbi:MAG: ATP-grasp domain-containing protein [Actinomycetota bacterium]
MPRVLLILPTSSYRVSDFLDAASGLGIEVVVAAEEELPLTETGKFIRIDCARPEAAAETIVNFAARTPIDAIVPVDDAGVVLAALAAERLGLAHNPPSAAAATRNKVALRRALEAVEVPQPTFRLVGGTDDAAPLAEVVGYPLVAKPLSLSGSRGVIKVDNAEGLEPVLERVRRINAVAGRSPGEPVLIEAFMPGPEVTLEGMLRRGHLETLAVFDKPDPLDGPYFEEAIYVTPSSLHPEILEEVERVAGLATSAVGLTEGPVHIELRITDGRVRVVEVAARSIGGLCGRALRFGLLGTSLESLILRHAVGRSHPIGAPIRRSPKASGVMMLPIRRAGTLKEVVGIDRALAVPGVDSVEITASPGSELRPVPDADRYLGFIFGSGEAPPTVVDSLRTAEAMLEVVLN